MKRDNPPDGDAGPHSLTLSLSSSSSGGKRKNALGGKEPILTLEFENSGGVVVLHCCGDILFRNEFQTLPAVVAEVLPAARRLIVNLAGVDSIDSGGLGELVLTYMWAEAAGYELKFAAPKQSVQELFELTNLASMFDVYASIPEAMSAMPRAVARSA